MRLQLQYHHVAGLRIVLNIVPTSLALACNMRAISHLKRPVIHRTGSAYLWRFIRVQLIPETLVRFAGPDFGDAAFDHTPKVNPIRRRDHTTGHRIALVAEVRTA